MKLRNGFVSNSSSSSFIIAAEPTAKRLVFTVEMDLSDVIRNSASTIEELNEHFAHEYGYSLEEIAEDSYLKDRYDACAEAIRAGKTVHFGRAGNEDYSGAGSYIYENGLPHSKAFEIIEDCNC